MQTQLFLDMDGVLANLIKRATAVLGMDPNAFEAEFGAAAMWKKLYEEPDFFLKMEKLGDADELVEAVRHLDPIILTGKPRGDWAEPQKRLWAMNHYPYLKLISCPAREKFKHMIPGKRNIIVDDRLQHSQIWIDAGGIWVDHKNTTDSLHALRELGLRV